MVQFLNALRVKVDVRVLGGPYISTLITQGQRLEPGRVLRDACGD